MSHATWPSLWRIDQAKIGRYLLNLDHPEGGPKARFFLGFGFSPEAAQVFAEALAAHPWNNPPGRLVTPPIGLPRLIFEGALPAPDGRAPRVRTVWERESNAVARLLTA